MRLVSMVGFLRSWVGPFSSRPRARIKKSLQQKGVLAAIQTTRVDSCHRRNRAEFSDRCIDDLGVVDDVGIVAHRDLDQRGSCADFGVGAELGVLHGRAGINGGLDRKRLAGHVNVPGYVNCLVRAQVFGVFDDIGMTRAWPLTGCGWMSQRSAAVT